MKSSPRTPSVRPVSRAHRRAVAAGVVASLLIASGAAARSPAPAPTADADVRASANAPVMPGPVETFSLWNAAVADGAFDAANWMSTGDEGLPAVMRRRALVRRHDVDRLIARERLPVAWCPCPTRDDVAIVFAWDHQAPADGSPAARPGQPESVRLEAFVLRREADRWRVGVEDDRSGERIDIREAWAAMANTIADDETIRFQVREWFLDDWKPGAPRPAPRQFTVDGERTVAVPAPPAPAIAIATAPPADPRRVDAPRVAAPPPSAPAPDRAPAAAAAAKWTLASVAPDADLLGPAWINGQRLVIADLTAPGALDGLTAAERRAARPIVDAFRQAGAISVAEYSWTRNDGVVGLVIARVIRFRDPAAAGRWWVTTYAPGGSAAGRVEAADLPTARAAGFDADRVVRVSGRPKFAAIRGTLGLTIQRVGSGPDVGPAFAALMQRVGTMVDAEAADAPAP